MLIDMWRWSAEICSKYFDFQDWIQYEDVMEVEEAGKPMFVIVVPEINLCFLEVLLRL